SIGCIHFTFEPRSHDYPGSLGCDNDHCTDDYGGFDPETCVQCPRDNEGHECGPDCPDFAAVLDEATARGV
ncbi:MAG: hypothetical protein ACYC99_08920, partial [Candidatus Geothermincolia bacterium]